jgi:GTP cyclohydrolase I
MTLPHIFNDATFVANEHIAETPRRFVQMLQQMTSPEPFEFTTFDTEHDEMVVVRDIDFVSLCAHHIVPFIGKAHIGYIPRGQLCGLSKIARTVRFEAATLTVQEDLTARIANFLELKLVPHGVAVVLEAEHMCMALRGVKAPGALTTTSKMTGAFADHTRLARSEFLQLIGRPHV